MIPKRLGLKSVCHLHFEQQLQFQSSFHCKVRRSNSSGERGLCEDLRIRIVTHLFGEITGSDVIAFTNGANSAASEAPPVMRHCWEVVSEAMLMAQPWWNADGRNFSKQSKLAHPFEKWPTDKFTNSQVLIVLCQKWNYSYVVEWYI